MKQLLFLFLFLLSYFPVFCQLDSISVTAHFEMVNVQPEEGDPVSVKIIRTETWVNDFDFFGEIVVEFTEISTGYTVYIVKKTKQQIIHENLITNNVIRIPGYNIEEQRSYKVRFIIRDYQGNHILEPEFTLIH